MRLAADVAAELRAQYPRLRVVELVERIAAYRLDCFAGAKSLGFDIGVSGRTVFRYLRKMKLDGIVERIWGDRHSYPRDATQPLALKAHGYKLTRFKGWLASAVEQSKHRAKERETRRQRAEIAKAERRAEKRAREIAQHAAWQNQRFPDAARRAGVVDAPGLVAHLEAPDVRPGERRPAACEVDLVELAALTDSFQLELDAARAPPE